jgi:outer membrane protein TolC
VNYPTYYVGIEFKTALDSDLLRGQIADAEVAFSQTQTQMAIDRYKAQNSLNDFERQVASQYSVAKASLEVVEMRARVVAQLESAYRQGRQPLVELIRAYNDLFTAQFDRAKAVGDYHIRLNELAASRDELVNNVQ